MGKAEDLGSADKTNQLSNQGSDRSLGEAVGLRGLRP